MAPPLRVRLDQAAHDELERRYHTTRDATTRTRYQMILLRAEDHPVVEVAQLTRCSPDTVRRVLKRYLAGGPDAVPHRPHLGQPPHYPPAWEAELVRVADLDPHEVGVDSALWSCRLLADYLHRGHRVSGGDRERAGRVAPGGVCVQAAPLGAVAQGAGPAGVGKKRVRVEALLAAAAAAVPPPAA